MGARFSAVAVISCQSGLTKFMHEIGRVTLRSAVNLELSGKFVRLRHLVIHYHFYALAFAAFLRFWMASTIAFKAAMSFPRSVAEGIAAALADDGS